MSFHLLKLRRVHKKFNGFESKPIDLEMVVTLVREIFGTEPTDSIGLEKLVAFNELLEAGKGLVQSREDLLNERRHEDLDAEDLEILQETEAELNKELAFFCETFNHICALAGVVKYFDHDNADVLWQEISDYLSRDIVRA